MKARRIHPSTLAILMICLGSCSGISFDPDFALPNLRSEVLRHEDGRRIPFQSREMLDYACMHKDKVRELAELLEGAQLKDRSSEIMSIYKAIRENNSEI